MVKNPWAQEATPLSTGMGSRFGAKPDRFDDDDPPAVRAALASPGAEDEDATCVATISQEVYAYSPCNVRTEVKVWSSRGP